MINALFSFFHNEEKLRKVLFWTWLLLPLAFFLYLFLPSSQQGQSLREVLQDPNVALSFLLACMSIVTAFVFQAASRENENTERIFCVFAVVQQLLSGNIVGFFFSYMLARSLWGVQRDKFAPSAMRWVILGGMGLLSFLTLLTLIARVNQIISA